MMCYSTVVLLPKSDGGHRGIGLQDTLWKVVSAIMDSRCKAEIKFHDALHGYVAHRGTGTAITEAKLFQQLAAISQQPAWEVFVDLRKAFDCVDRTRTLEILEQYGVGPRMLRVLTRYWEQQLIVARQAGFYGEPFHPSRGTTQGDMLSPTLFNIVVDAVVRYWLSVISEGDEETGGFGHGVRNRLALFYADDSLVASTNHEWLQVALPHLSSAFARVGLLTNTDKTKAMVCLPTHVSGRLPTSVYDRIRTREGQDYRQRQRRRVICTVCGADLAASSLAAHRRTQHGLASDPGYLFEEPEPEPTTFHTSFPLHMGALACPVPECTGFVTSRVGLGRHFVYRHPEHTVVIAEEGTAPLPRCDLCGMQVSPLSRFTSHRESGYCLRMAAMRRQRETIAAARRSREIVFQIDGVDLETVPSFKYLGRLLTSTDDDWPAVAANLRKARQRWAMVSRILRKDNMDPGVAGWFYKALAQSVLLYGSETWVLTKAMITALEGFHHRVARSISGQKGRYIAAEDRWVYPPIETALAAAKLYPLEHYLSERRNRLVDTIATRPILTLCMESERLSGAAPRKWWWQNLDLE